MNVLLSNTSSVKDAPLTLVKYTFSYRSKTLERFQEPEVSDLHRTAMRGAAGVKIGGSITSACERGDERKSKTQERHT